MDISEVEDAVKTMGFTGLCGGFKEETSLAPASAVIDKCFDALKETITSYRRLYPNVVTGPARDISLASSEERRERTEKWTYVPARLECLKKASFDDVGEPLWVGHNPTAFDGFGFWELLPGEAIEVPRWVVEFVNKNCSEFAWRSVEKSEAQLALESGRGPGAVQKCGIGYTSMLVREAPRRTYQLNPA